MCSPASATILVPRPCETVNGRDALCFNCVTITREILPRKLSSWRLQDGPQILRQIQRMTGRAIFTETQNVGSYTCLRENKSRHFRSAQSQGLASGSSIGEDHNRRLPGHRKDV